MKKLLLFALMYISTMGTYASENQLLSGWFYTPNDSVVNDSVAIVPVDSTEYDIVIIEIGFESWMATNAKPKWYYSNAYYRNKNQFYVIDWNNRVIETMGKPPFEFRINYNPNVDYGLDVNYQLYWYFRYVQEKYGIKLSGTGKVR